MPDKTVTTPTHIYCSECEGAVPLEVNRLETDLMGPEAFDYVGVKCRHVVATVYWIKP
jgi:hypothetical protein